MHRFPPLAPPPLAPQKPQRPAIALALADLPLGEITVLSLLALLLALA